MPDLLIELFSEEIPARMQTRAADDLRRLMTDGMVEAGLTYAGAKAFATPRRLALTVQGLSAESPTLHEERRGPRVGAPDKAVDGFCKSAGVSRDDLDVRDDRKGQVYVARVITPGRPASVIVADVLTATVTGFPWPKAMRWGSGDLRWVRPLHGILCLLSDEAGAEVVDVEIAGLRAGATTRGHRFMAPAPFSVTGFDDYTAKLTRAKVMLDAAERAAHIRQDAESATFARGLHLVEDAGLLSEVAGLVEWPVVLVGEIDPRFRDLPAEVLQTSMKTHQKFFSVRGGEGSGRITHFVTVANRETADDGAAILAGNGRVLAARLADAAFFWERDLAVARAGMNAWLDGLKAVTFHAELGSQADRIGRIAALAREIAPLVGADADVAERAARVAKADLQSEMVGEFPELQGIMGRYYADAAGMPPEIAAACGEHYAPLGPSDAVPTAPVSVAVALADKIDMLTGFWAIDEKPTGSKDPFALRRAALGVIRLVLENGVRMPLLDVFDHMYQNRVISEEKQHEFEVAEAREEFEKISGLKVVKTESARFVVDTGYTQENFLDFNSAAIHSDVAIGVVSFLHDRLKVYLRDRGIPHDVIDACLAMPGADDLNLLVNRAEALAAFFKTEDGENLIQGFRRANNILTQAEAADGVEYSFGPDARLAETDEERALFAALDRENPKIAAALATEHFVTAMHHLALLRAPLDAFFGSVQVNSENRTLRRNRLNLLHVIRAACLQVADLARLQG